LVQRSCKWLSCDRPRTASSSAAVPAAPPRMPTVLSCSRRRRVISPSQGHSCAAPAAATLSAAAGQACWHT
jgi:hypothetical protein